MKVSKGIDDSTHSTFIRCSRFLQWYRNAKVMHAHLAMLAVARWPLAELFHKNIASSLDLNPLLINQNQVPSVLNGRLSHTSPPFTWVAAIGAAGNH
jgi:hypothetical protein